MKSLLLVMATSIWAATNPNGCGAAIGADQGKVPNGQADAGPGIDGGLLPQTNCGALGYHYFCDDFSEPSLPARFDNMNTSAGTLSLDTSQAASPPQSLLANTLHITTGTRTFAQLAKSFPVSGTRFQLAFSEYVDPTCVGPADGVQTGVIGMNSNTYWLAVDHGQNNDSVAETSISGGVYIQGHVLASPIPRSSWARVVLDADMATGTVDLTVNGTVVMENEPLRYSPGSPQTPSISVGVLTDNITFNPAACDMRIDDVTFDVQP